MEREVDERFKRIEALQEAHALAMAQLDEHLTHLAAMQIVTEQKLQGLIDALRRSGNGKPPAGRGRLR